MIGLSIFANQAYFCAAGRRQLEAITADLGSVGTATDTRAAKRVKDGASSELLPLHSLIVGKTPCVNSENFPTCHGDGHLKSASRTLLMLSRGPVRYPRSCVISIYRSAELSSARSTRAADSSPGADVLPDHRESLPL